ncbi:hypothetical protein KI387_021151, partial [Taxus chinensis]
MSGSGETLMGNSQSSQVNRLGLSYGIVISVGTMVVLTVILLASYICIRLRVTTRGPGTGRARVAARAVEMDLDMERGGVDEATLDTYPKMIYSDKVRGGGGGGGG